jgi:hypothetical protein
VFPDPLKQKLVEPQALAFGGGLRNEANNFNHVNWQMLMDYFHWEALTYAGEQKSAEWLQEDAVRKYGRPFIHYEVYKTGNYY